MQTKEQERKMRKWQRPVLLGRIGDGWTGQRRERRLVELILVIGEDAYGAARQRGRAGTKQPINLTQI
jgi:hypothetical protein